MLEQLTANTLFCKYCCRPFLMESVREELTTPYAGFIDLVSSSVFIVLLWIPMVVVLGIISVFELVFMRFLSTSVST